MFTKLKRAFNNIIKILALLHSILEEIKLLRVEIDNLKTQNNEKTKTKRIPRT